LSVFKVRFIAYPIFLIAIVSAAVLDALPDYFQHYQNLILTLSNLIVSITIELVIVRYFDGVEKKKAQLQAVNPLMDIKTQLDSLHGRTIGIAETLVPRIASDEDKKDVRKIHRIQLKAQDEVCKIEGIRRTLQ